MSVFAAVGQPKSMYHETDTRYNLSELPPELDQGTRMRIKQQAQSIACLVEKSQLIETTKDGVTQHRITSRVLTLAEKLQANYEEGYKAHCAQQNRTYHEEEAKASYKGPFQNEPSLGDGTAFLVGSQLILTAAHCICDPSSKLVSRVKLTGLRVIFGFQMQPSGQIQTTFESKDVYRIDAVWQYRHAHDADWALLKLDREVEGRQPLSLAASQMVALNTSLYMLGYPSGLPLKLTLSGQVQKTNNPHFFEADLDAFAGNSGSPVFANDTGNMIGMLIRGNKDYADSTSSENKQEKTLQVSQTSKQEIERNGYEKCHKIASIGFVKTVLSSSFKLAVAHFSGRTQYLAKLKAHLTVLAPSTQVHILYGPGGVGKSELAIAFANSNIEDFSFIWSISCGTAEEQFVGYQGLAKRLEIPLEDKETLSSMIHKVHRKLEQNRSKPWLLLLDNLQETPEPPNFPPLPVKGGSLLITSYKSLQIQSLPQGAVAATEVLPLEPMEALQFLEAMTEKPTTDCTKLLDHVGCYPLVLGQVASYIKHTGIEVEDYLANLEQCHAVLAVQEKPSKAPKLEAAFSMTLQQLSPAAKKWLFLCSRLNAALIPLSYLKAWLKSESIAEEQAAIIATLEEHALLRYNTQEEHFSLHLEFQRILRSVAPVDTGLQAAHLLVDVQNECDFENTNNWKGTMTKATVWASHAELIVESAGQMPLDSLEKASLLAGLGNWENASARYDKSLTYHAEALKIRRAALGENHPDVANSLNGIGTCYNYQGNYAGALKMYGEALKIYKAALEKNHPDVAMSLNNIGTCYGSQGNYAEALKVHREALKIRRAALGENHPDVADSLNNIGRCYDSQGKYAEALKIYGEALKIRRAALGENHPSVAVSLNNIGTCYYSQGNYAEALKIYGEALKIYRAALGENHPSVATSLTGIGSCYKTQGKYAEALKVHREALKIRRAALGKNHPSVAVSLNNIGTCYYSQGNYAEALNMYGEALKISRTALGENHPDVATSLHNIGNCYDSQGNYAEALKMYGEALKIRRAALGDNHPNVAVTLRDIERCQKHLNSSKQPPKLQKPPKEEKCTVS